MPDTVFKLCIFGDGGVGKTTLVRRYLTSVFTDDSTMTIGVDFHVKTLEVKGRKVALQIWDFAGEERFRFLLPSYVRGASGGIFMYDITRYSSLKNMEEWLNILKGSVEKEEKRVPLLMVGGKLDLEHKRSVPMEETIKMAKTHDILEIIECSAKTGRNVEQIFESISRIMLEKAGFI